MCGSETLLRTPECCQAKGRRNEPWMSGRWLRGTATLISVAGPRCKKVERAEACEVANPLTHCHSGSGS